MAGEQGINVGSIVADLQVDSTHMERGLANARKALDAVEGELRRLDDELNRGRIQLTDYTERMMALNRTEAQLTASMNAAFTATTRVHTGLELVNRGMSGASSSTNMFGMGLMQLGYIVDDIQYGFQAVVNNVAPFTYSIVASMGASTQAAMAWASGVQIAGVAAYQLYRNWDRAMDLMGLGKVMTEAEEMDALAKNTKRTADETARLNKYKKEQKEIQDLLEARPPEEGKREKAARAAVAAIGDEKATGGEKLVKALADSFRAQGLGAKMKPEEKEELDKIRDRINGKVEAEGGFWGLFQGAVGVGGVAGPANEAAEQARKKVAQEEFNRRQKEINDRINTEDADRAKRAANNAVKNVDDTRAAIRRLEKNPANREIVEALKATLPENVMAKNIGTIFGKMREKIEDALPKFFKRDKDQRTKEANEEQDFNENARTVFKSAVNDTKEQAKDLIPGLGDIAKFHVARGLLGGNPADLEDAKSQVMKTLRDQGINVGVAGEAVKGIFKDAEVDLKEDVVRKMLGGEKDAKSQQFDATELASRVQAGVGDESKKHTTLMQKMVHSLAVMEAAAGNIPFGAE